MGKLKGDGWRGGVRRHPSFFYSSISEAILGKPQSLNYSIKSSLSQEKIELHCRGTGLPGWGGHCLHPRTVSLMEREERSQAWEPHLLVWSHQRRSHDGRLCCLPCHFLTGFQ